MPFVLKRTVTETFLSRVSITPDQVAYRFYSAGAWRDVTFSEFYVDARTVSFGLMSLGLKAEDRVAIIANTRYEWSLCDMAILGARAITVPVYASNSAEELHYILNHSEARVAFVENGRQLEKLNEVLTQDPNAFPKLERIIVLDPIPAEARVSALGERLSTLSDLRRAGETEEFEKPGRFTDNLSSATPDDVITICYTSGTTGIPKGVLLTHDNMITVLTDCIVLLEDHLQEDGEIVLSFLPVSHILGKVESVATHVFGWVQVFARSLEHLNRDFREVRPTIVFSVPRTFEKAHELVLDAVARSSDFERRAFEWACDDDSAFCRPKPRTAKLAFQLPFRRIMAKQLVFKRVAAGFGGRLKFAVCGGAPLPKEIGEFFYRAGILILEGYGLTETCAPVTLNTPERLRFGTVGRPMPEVTLKVAEDGEILIRSRRLFKGYYKMPEETSEALRDGWFHTGDIGRLDTDGFLEITDRKKDIIITSGGKNIAPQKIENMAMLDKLIHQFVVHGDRRPYLTALLTLNRDYVLDYANRNHILFSEYSELVKNPRIISLAQKAIDRVNDELASFETVKKFIVLPDDFTLEAGELTPSLKLRRGFINRKYQPLLDSMYPKATKSSGRPVRRA